MALVNVWKKRERQLKAATGPIKSGVWSISAQRLSYSAEMELEWRKSKAHNFFRAAVIDGGIKPHVRITQADRFSDCGKIIPLSVEYIERDSLFRGVIRGDVVLSVSGHTSMWHGLVVIVAAELDAAIEAALRQGASTQGSERAVSVASMPAAAMRPRGKKAQVGPRAKTDVSDEPFWKLRTAIYWIATGEARDISALRAELEAAHDGKQGEGQNITDQFAKAEAELRRALGFGKLEGTGRRLIPLDAMGVNAALSHRQIIDPKWWGTAMLDADENRARQALSSPVWEVKDIRVSSLDVRTLWPARVSCAPMGTNDIGGEGSSEPDATPRPNAADEDDLDAAYAARCQQLQAASGRLPTMKEDEVWRVGKCTQKGLRMLRGKHRPIEKKKPGRPKK